MKVSMTKHIDNVFDMFYRGSLNSDGSGLGLYIVREVVHKLKGTIYVQNSAMGGTVFYDWTPFSGLKKQANYSFMEKTISISLGSSPGGVYVILVIALVAIRDIFFQQKAHHQP